MLSSTQTISVNRLRPVSVRPLDGRDREAFDLLYLSNPVRYITVRMNEETYGFDSEKVQNWGTFAEDGKTLCGIMTRFGNTIVAVDEDGRSAALFALTVDNERGLAGMRGFAPLVGAIGEQLCRYAPRQQDASHFLQLEDPVSTSLELLNRARRASLKDLDALALLYTNAGEMYRNRTNIHAKLTNDRVFIAERYDVRSGMTQIVSCALTNVEGTEAGVIGGVYTMPVMRGRGYAEAVTSALCYDLQRDGKMPCLYYENPIAGRVYSKLGFVKRDEWSVMFFRVVNPPRRHTP